MKTDLARRVRLCTAGLIAAILACALSACGSSSSSSSESGGSSASSSNSGDAVTPAHLAEAKAAVARTSAPPTNVSVGVPLTKKPAPGSLFVQVGPPSPTTTENEQFFEQAASALGAKARLISPGTTADQLQAAFSSAAALKPAGVWVSGLDPKLWQKYGAQWAKEGVPVVNQGTGWPNQNGKTFNFQPAGAEKVWAEPLANWVIADANGKKTSVLTVTPSDIPIFRTAQKDIAARITTLCPTCKVADVAEPLAESGKGLPSAIVGYLEKNPDVKYVVVELGPTAIGLVPALRTAGLADKVKLVVDAPGPAQNAELKQGDYAVAEGVDQASQAYVVADFLARAMTHQNTAPDFKWNFPIRFLYKGSNFDVNQNWTAGGPTPWLNLWKG